MNNMHNVTLIKGRHQLIMNGDLPMLSDGNLFIQDVQDNNIFASPVCEETIKFFNLQITEESLIHDNNNSNKAGMLELSQSVASTTACWKDDNEVKCLIYLWKDHQNHFQNMKSRDVWPLISEELHKTNLEWKKKSPIQCENKWKDVKRKYMETKDHNSKSGNDPKTCKFYEDLEEVLGDKPCVKPIAIASNLNKRKIESTSSTEQNSEDISEDCGSETQTEAVLQKKKRKMTRIQRELQNWSSALLADTKTREEARERRHKENIAELRAANDTYKEIMKQLIDKL